MHVDVYLILYNIYFFLSGAEEEEDAVAAAAVVEIEDAEAVEAEVEEAVAVIEIIKIAVIILARTWIISNLNILDMDIENVTRIIETREDIKEAVRAVGAEEVAVGAEEVEEAIAEIPAQITVKIMVKVTVRIMIINSRSIPAKEIRMEATIEAVETIIRTGGKVADEEAEFKVDGIKVPIIPV